MQKTKVAVIGAGSLGKHHIRVLHSLDIAELVAICDVNQKEGAAIAQQYRIPFFNDYKQLTDRVDAVTIATPTAFHFLIAEYFLTHQIHTLIEKPITLQLEEADKLICLSRKNKLALQVGHIERHNAAFKKVEELANKVKFIEVHRLGPFTPRVKDCGVIHDLMIHDFDIVLSLVRQEIEYLDAVGISVLTKHEDIANVRIKFKNGTIANLTASRLTPEKQRKIRIFQNDSYISLDYQNQEVKICKKGLFGIQQEHLTIEKEEPLQAEIRSFIQSIQNGSGLGQPDIEARNALALAIQCLDIVHQNNERFYQNK